MQKQPKGHRTRKISLAVGMVVVAALLLGLGATIYQSEAGLTVSHYIIPADVTETVKIVQLSDLHNSQFGPDNQELIQRVTGEQPDLILLTGDLLNRQEEDTRCATQLIEQLSEIAPVYASLGNHEIAYEETYGVDIIQLYTDAGATVLEKNYVDLVVNHQALRIGGLYDYCLPIEALKENPGIAETCAFLTQFQNTPLWTILLCHMPVSWISYGSLDSWSIDCVFAGHAHGGEVILPGIGGLYGPDQGWFPGRLWGTFSSEDGERTLILSRGLGTAQIIPRINNIPEIVTVDLIPKQNT